MAASLRDLQCFVFDMDGTINLGETPVDGAKDLISFLQARRIPFFFFTNNSSASPEVYVEKLQRLGFSGIGRERIVTSGDVMAHVLKPIPISIWPGPRLLQSSSGNRESPCFLRIRPRRMRW